MMQERCNSSDSEDPDSPCGRAGRVLVVDDDPSVRSSIGEILRVQGFTVLEAGDGAAATWLIADEEFDVVILDLRLCHVDGTVVLEALEPTANVVIVSAFSYFDEAVIRDEFKSKVFASLRKPVPPQRLIEVVTAAAAAVQHTGESSWVRPIAPRNALRLGLAALAEVGPQELRSVIGKQAL